MIPWSRCDQSGGCKERSRRFCANPLGTIMAGAMMLDHLGHPASATRIESAVANLLLTRRIPSVGADSGLSTRQVGDMVCGEIVSVG